MKDRLLKLFQFILIIIIIVCLFIIGKRLYDDYNNKQNKAYIDKIIEETDISEEHKELSEFEKKQIKYMKILRKFHQQNEDVVGYIEIPGTNINYPILQTDNNDYYLERSLNREYDIGGSIFIDTNNSSDFSDDNTVVYGHNLAIGTMFTQLLKYGDQQFAQEHTVVYITTFDGLYEYRVFSSYAIPADYDYRNLNFSNDEEKLEYFNKLKSNSEVEIDNDEFKAEDKIITLSTCQFDYEDERRAVQAVRIR